MSTVLFDTWRSLDGTKSIRIEDISGIGASGGSTTVSTHADLAGVDGTTIRYARTLGYYTVGDGGAAQYEYISGSWVLIHDGAVNVLQFGAKPDASGNTGTDNTAAFNAATAAADVVIVPEGSYRITNTVTLREDCALRGVGRLQSILHITSAYTANTGFVSLDHGSELVDIGFQFYQPDKTSRAACIQYPWAVEFVGSTRVLIDRVRISSGWNGMTGLGNTGGSYLGFIEVGVLNTGLELDGGLDFFHGVKWHFWPFGMTVQPGLMNLYKDGNGTAVSVGALDGFNVENLATFQTKVVFTSNAGGVIPYLIGNLQLDGDGARLIADAGVISIAKAYDTKSSDVTVHSIYVSGTAVVNIGHLRTSSDAKAYSTYVDGSGRLHVHGGDIRSINALGGAMWVQNGVGIMDNVTMAPSASTVYSNAYCVQAGGTMKVRGCNWTAKGAGSGVGAYLSSNNASNEVVGNDFNGWQLADANLGRHSGAVHDNTNLPSSFYGGNLVVYPRCIGLSGNADGSGLALLPHGVADANQRVTRASAFYRGNSGEAVPVNAANIDGTYVRVTGVPAGVAVRVYLEYTPQALATW